MLKKMTKEYWNEEHLTGYKKTFDINVDQSFFNYLLQIIHTPKKILIIGCGSNPSLQRLLIEKINSVEKIVCVDYSEVAIECSKNIYNHPSIVYLNDDIKNIDQKYNNYFDTVLNVNSLLNVPLDEYLGVIQKTMVLNCMMYSLFPALFCQTDVVLNISKKQSKQVPVEVLLNNRFGYTPLYIFDVTKGLDLNITMFSIYFFSTDKYMEMTSKIYNITEPIWEFFVVLKKKGK